MHRLGQGVTHTRDGSEGVGAGPQVGDLTQVLEAVALVTRGVGVGVLDPADDLDLFGLDLNALPFALRFDQIAGDLDRAAGRQLGDIFVVGQIVASDGLDRVKAGPVVDRDERQPAVGLGVTLGADPALDGDRLPGVGCECVFDLEPGHASLGLSLWMG